MEKGWQNRREVNRVVFDPAETSVERLEEILRRAGTYRRTLAPGQEPGN